jgi:hypothetical protein
VTAELVIDLVTVSAYEVNGARVLVPQRIDPERQPLEIPLTSAAPKDTGHLISPEDFAAEIDNAAVEHRADLRRMYDWATGLRDEGVIQLLAYRGTTGRSTLLPYVPGEDAGLITVWNDGGFYISLWRSVFERRAEQSIGRVEQLIAPAKLGRGNTVREVSDELLAALTDAYREAARSGLRASSPTPVYDPRLISGPPPGSLPAFSLEFFSRRGPARECL